MTDDNAAKPMANIRRPIYIIGAGGIVNDAHLPAYSIAGYDVRGIYDIKPDKALATAEKFSISKIFETLTELVDEAAPNAIYDVAVPASSVSEILQQLPGGSTVLIQKPMGSNLDEATKILELTRSKRQVAAVNFQLRYAPAIVQARKMINEGLLGEIYDIEVNINVFTPWHLWDFLFSSPRVEILYHSVHYIDLVRSFLGNPQSIYAKTVKHPEMAQLASVRSSIIMDYGETISPNIRTNHCHRFGLEHQQSYIKFEGTRGAITITFGVLKNYPKGDADKFDYILLDENLNGEWKSFDIEGTWFPHAFIGSMNELMTAALESRKPDHSVEDCIYTMACVEAAYRSSESGGTRLEAINIQVLPL